MSLRSGRIARAAIEASAGGLAVFLAGVTVWSLGAVLVPYVPLLAPGHRSDVFLGVLTVLSSALFIHLSRLHPLIGRMLGPDGPGRTALRMRFCILAAAAGGCMAFSHHLWSARMDALRRETREHGFAATLSDLHVERSPERNAHPGLDRVIRGLEGPVHADVGGLRMGIGRLDEKQYERVRAALRPYEDFLRKSVDPELEKYDHYAINDYRKAPEAPYKLKGPELNRFLLLGNLSFYMATEAAYRGDLAAADLHAGRCLKLARLAASVSALEAQMTALSIERRCAHGAVNILLHRRRAVLSPAVSEGLRDALAVSKVDRGLQFRLAQLLDLQRHEWDPDAFSFEDSHLNILFRTGWLLTAAAGAVDAGLVQRGRWLLGLLLRREAPAQEKVDFAYWPFFFEKQRIRLNFRGFRSQERRYRTWARLALVHSALNAYRRSEGAYPDSLRALAPGSIAPGLLLDPYGRGDLRYAVRGDGFELSSRGPAGDGTDGERREFLLRVPG